MSQAVVTIFVNGDFQYEVGNLFMKMLADELEKSVKVNRIDARQPSAQIAENIKVAVKNKTICFISYNALFADATLGQPKSLYDSANIPFLAWMVDHPLHHRERLANAGENVIVGCVDKAHTQLVGLTNPNDVSSFFCPHFACIPENSIHTTTNKADPSTFTVIMPGSFGVPAVNQVAAITSRGPMAEELFYALTNAAQYDASFDIFSAAIQCLQGQNIHLSQRDLSVFLSNTILPIDDYIRAKRREDLLYAMKAVGIVVDIYGNCIEDHPVYDGHRFHGPLDISELLTVIHSCDVLLDSGANFTNGTHERALTGLGLGKVVVSPKNRLWAESFSGMSNALLYQPAECLGVAEQLLALKAKKSNLEEQGDGLARQAVLGMFSVSNTANAVLDMLSLRDYA